MSAMDLGIEMKAVKHLPAAVTNVLDLGAGFLLKNGKLPGPSVRMSLVLRNRAENIFVSDYAQINNQAVVDWVLSKSEYNWDKQCAVLTKLEGSTETPEEIQAAAREKVRAVLKADIYNDKVLTDIFWKRSAQQIIPKKFQVVISNFCVTNVSQTPEGFLQAIKNAVSLVEDGGYLVLAGMMKESFYRVGKIDYQCMPHDYHDTLQALKFNGMATTESEGMIINIEPPVYFLITRKRIKMADLRERKKERERERAAAIEIGGKIYATGEWNGINLLKTIEVYDPAKGNWEI